MLSTDHGRHWTLGALRWPSLVWTFATAAMAGLLAWRASNLRHVGLLAAGIYLAFLSTYRYGRPYLTNPPETFWVFACFFIMLWWRPRSFESRIVFPTLVGLCAGTALFAKSFAQLVPIGASLVAWHLHDVRRPDGGPDWRRLCLRSAPGLAWTAALALAVFSLWFLLDPDPAAIWRARSMVQVTSCQASLPRRRPLLPLRRLLPPRRPPSKRRPRWPQKKHRSQPQKQQPSKNNLNGWPERLHAKA
jgi:hypothetical protein